MGHYYNYYNNKYNPGKNYCQEEIKEPPATLTPKAKKCVIPAFGDGNPCYTKAMDFAVECGKLCIRMSETKNIVICNYANQLSKSSSSPLLNLSEGTTPFISDREKILRFTICNREAQESISNLILISELFPHLLPPNERDALVKLAQEIISILNKSIYTIKKKM